MVETFEDRPVYRLRDLVASMYHIGRMSPKQIERFADKRFIDSTSYWAIVEELAEKRYFDKRSAEFNELEKNGYRSRDYMLALLYTTSLSLEEMAAVAKQIPEYSGMEDIAEHFAKRRYSNLLASGKIKKVDLPKN